jgi:hypothetical protein
VTDDSNANATKIGELLIAVGALTSGDLTEAIQIAKRMNVPIGRVLVMSGCVNEVNLQHTLKLQSLVKDNLVDLETGINALKLVFKDGIELEAALKSFNWTPNKDQAGNKLGDLLVDSTIVTRAQLDRALEASFQSGMPLGGTLVLQGVLSPQLLPTVLQTQEQIRDGKLTRDDAIEQLKLTLMYWARAGESKQTELQTAAPASGPPAAPSKPSGVFTAPVSASESLQQQQHTQPSVQPFVHPAQQSQQAPAAVPSADPSDSGIRKMSISHVRINTGGEELTLVELLMLSGFCTETTLDKAINDALMDDRLASKLLLSICFVDSEMVNNVIRCKALLVRGALKTDQVLYALNSIRHRKISFEQAIAELGINTPA